MPANDLKELIAWLKANPDKAAQGTSGAGASSHIAGVFFEKETGARFQFVPYRGAGPAMQDLMAGQIDLMIDPASNSLPQVRAGTIKAYAVTAKSRLAAASEIPTVDEAGLPGFYVSTWLAIFVPQGHAEEHHRQAQRCGRGSAWPIRRSVSGWPILAMEIPQREQQTPEALGTFHKAEIEKWWPIIKAAGIKAE